MKKIHLGKMLLENNIITQDQLNIATQQQQATGEKLGKILVNLGFIKEEKFLQLLSKQLEIPYVDLKNYPLRPEIVHLLPELYARRFRAILLDKTPENFLVGMVDPLDILATDELTRVLNNSIQIALVREDELLDIINMIYRRTTEISGFAGELSSEMKNKEFEIPAIDLSLAGTDAPVVKLIHSILEDAVQVNASDVHIEPDENLLRIRLRIDGVLHEQEVEEIQVAPALTLRLKLMAGLNIAEKRLPQDGRFSIKIKGKNFDVRMSTLPVQFGESVVMRLLNQSSDILSLNSIGMPKETLAVFRRIFSMPNGIVLITGPTGSGKTTTLYGVLTELNDAESKIITVEDPVEYRLPRISQVQVQTKIDLTFANILRSMLRQDPDIIMIGELRDKDTVDIALRAAMTGHLVLTTLHTNDAISSVMRLIDMGAEPYIVATVLRGILAQRLVRRICQNCITDHTLTTQEKTWLQGVASESYINRTFKAGKGCTYCHKTGYKGQIGVYELLEMNATLADALRKHDDIEFKNAVKAQKTFKTLLDNGLELAEKGITSVSEVMRITGEEL